MAHSFGTIGEVLIRLTAQRSERLIQARQFDVIYGGTECNVAVALERFGVDPFLISRIPDNDIGRNVWVPASTVIPSVYAFNDRVAAPWFAPAGLNRGGIDIAVQTERKLTHSNHSELNS